MAPVRQNMVPDDPNVGVDGGGLLSGVGQGMGRSAQPSTSQAFQRRTLSDAAHSLSAVQRHALMHQGYGPPVRPGYDESILQTIPGASFSEPSPYRQQLDFDDGVNPPFSVPAHRQLNYSANGLPVRHSSVNGGVAGYIPDDGDPDRHTSSRREPHHYTPLNGGSSRHYPANDGPYRQNIPQQPPIWSNSSQAIPPTMLVRSNTPNTEPMLARGESFPVMSARTGSCSVE